MVTRTPDLSDRVAALLAAGERQAARALVESAAPSQPADAELGRAAIALFDHHTDAVIDHARRAIELGAGGTGHQVIALGHLVADDAVAAIAHARKAVEIDPDARARRTLASVLLATGHAEEAAALLRELRAEQPDDADVLLNLGAASAELGAYGEAIVCYAQAYDLRPADTRPIKQLLEMFAAAGKWLGAAAALDLSRSGEPPPEVEVALDLVQVHLVERIASGFPDRDVDRDADRTIEKLVAGALARGPSTQLAVAQTLLDVDREVDARTLVAAAAERHARAPLDASALCDLRYLQACLAARDGNRALALTLYAQCIAGHARRTEVCTNAISLLLDDGSPGALAQIPSWIARVSPGDRQRDPGLAYVEAVYLSRTGRTAQARVRLEQVEDLTGGEGPVAALAAELLEQLGAGRDAR